jgi:xanthine dehydrogenase accessory factor
MSELRSILKLWSEARSQGEEICLARVVGVEGSSYRKPGARMLLTSGGRRAGTISGGCLEAEVQKKAWWLTASGPTVERYSTFYDEDSEMPYGLGCGGTVSVLLERGEAAGRVLAALEQSLTSRADIVFVTVTDPDSPGEIGTHLILLANGETLFESAPPVEALALARQALREKQSLWRGGLFAEYVSPCMSLLVVGAGDDAIPLVEFADRLGWQTTVVDGRSHLATLERFPWAERVLALRSFDELAVGERDAAVILTHSYEQDRAALRALLSRELGYVGGYLGILGPRRRTERLLAEVAPEIGLTVEECFARLHSPVGLKIGAKDPASIALAIVAEIYSVVERAGVEGANGKQRESVRSLRSVHG